MLPKFGLITEGVTDQIILKNILIGYFKDNDLIVRPLQPALDATDEVQMSFYGGEKRIYQRVSKDFMKNKILLQTYPKNPSFKLFMEQFIAAITSITNL